MCCCREEPDVVTGYIYFLFEATVKWKHARNHVTHKAEQSKQVQDSLKSGINIKVGVIASIGLISKKIDLTLDDMWPVLKYNKTYLTHYPNW